MSFVSKSFLSFLLFVWVCGAMMAESITSPEWKFFIYDFTVNTQGEPVYQLFYKGKAVVKPSKLAWN